MNVWENVKRIDSTDENVSKYVFTVEGDKPAVAEAVLYKYPGVQEAVVYGVPDEKMGEEVGAAIYVEGATPDATELRAYCKDHMAAYKIPRYVWFVSEPLPRNANGKFLKKALRESLDLADAC